MKPKAWSYSALNDFVNCPRQYHQKRIAKTVKEEPSEQMLWGEEVHLAFENRQKSGTPLPSNVSDHEEFMQKLQDLPGKTYTERKIALSKGLTPCEFFAPDAWYRGIIDFAKHHGKTALIVDYKTGKQHSKFEQLAMFAVHTFIQFPEIEQVHTKFYWTQPKIMTGREYYRSDLAAIWETLTPDLKQYVEAFKTDTWQPRPSGLCHGWCPVKDCEFWKPKRIRR